MIGFRRETCWPISMPGDEPEDLRRREAMIHSFAYEDLDSGWKLEEVSFGPLNLLVGPSGTGKTRILEALLRVRQMALHGTHGLPSARWRLVVEVDGAPIVWEAATRVGDLWVFRGFDVPPKRRLPWFVAERIERDGQQLVDRTKGDFSFKQQSFPARLEQSLSAVQLLGSDDAISPLHEALHLWRSLESVGSLEALETVRGAESSRQQLGADLDSLRRDNSLSPFLKLYVLQEDHPKLFARIVEDFVEVFPTIQDLRLASYADLGRPDLADSLALGLREEGVDGWVPHTALSSGMAKTLTFLIETVLAPKGTVLLIDELDNSLGINCLPEVAGRMLEGLDRIQYIATSHHPRVIHEIPFERWKLVTRRGSNVRVLDAGNIAVLKSASPLERFTELLNLPEYAEGVA